LEASNHDLQQFASVASHDLQEPLRKIHMFTHLLKTRNGNKLEEPDVRYLEKIIGSANRMKTLIVDVLNYSRLSSNNRDFIITDLYELVKDLLEDFELLIMEKQARIKYAQLPALQVNRGQMRQVFQNLISNALKFSKKDTVPLIEIEASLIATKSFKAKQKPNGAYCKLTVTDNGIGFDEKYKPNIFSLFERLHTKDQYEGTGIGLAITKKIVEKHHGLIDVKSQEGMGTQFIIVLPVTQKG
jgi:light-regulated signal transduction histidine kinase (bacteriophytochrome)